MKFFSRLSFVSSAPRQRPWHHWSKMASPVVYAQVCLDRIRLSYWYLSCDKRLTHKKFL